MPWFCCLQLFQTCMKSQGVAARETSSKPMAMQQRGCFGTLVWSLELFRVTPGKYQCWEAPESICRNLHLHKVVGRSCCRLWHSIDCKQQWLRDETEFYLLLWLKGNLEILRGRISSLHLWLCFQNAMDLDTEEQWGEEDIALASSFQPLSTCKSGSLKSHRARASLGWKQRDCALDPELSIFVFLWNQLDAECLQLKSRRDCNGSVWKWPILAQYHTVDNFQNRDDLLVYHRARSIMGFQFNVIKCHHKHEILKPSLNNYN